MSAIRSYYDQFPGSVSITAHLNANNLAEGTLVGAFVDNERNNFV